MWRRAENISRSKGAAATAATVTAAVAAAEKIMNRLIIQVISLNYLEDKINGFHVIARQRQINHISQHFPFFLLLFRSVLSLPLSAQLSSALPSSALENTKTLVVLNLHIKKSFFLLGASSLFFCIFRLSSESVSCHLVVRFIGLSLYTSVSLSAGEHIR